MTFQRPDLPTLVARGKADTAARLPGADLALRRSLVSVVSTVRAGAVHGLYGYLDWLARQLMPDTAEGEHLERWASIWKVSRLPATAASGIARFSGVSGAAIPAGTMLTRADGLEYITTEEGLIASGVALVAIQAVEAGAGGNLDSGAQLSLVSPLSGVQAQAVAEGDILGGADREGDESLRRRLMLRIQKSVRGGALDDYETWARDVPGVTRVWVRPGELGDGTVSVFFALDGLRQDGIPLEGDEAIVQAALDDPRPVTAHVFAVAPSPRPLGLSIRISPDLESVRAAVAAELADLVIEEAAPGGTLLVSHIREAISLAAGEYDHALLSPTGDVVCGPGELAVVGDIDWGDE